MENLNEKKEEANRIIDAMAELLPFAPYLILQAGRSANGVMMASQTQDFFQ